MSDKDIHELKCNAENNGHTLLGQSNKTITHLLIFAHKHDNILLRFDILRPEVKGSEITASLLIC